MARTNRKDVPPAPAPSVDALDDLNLDDMFEGGDDSLFDGLDIDLDGMGELPGALDENKKGAVMSESLDAMKFDLLDSSAAHVTSSTKRRKTKRKAKTPPPLEDESGDEISTTKKKRRIAKATNKNSRSKSKQKDEPPSPASSATSSKSKSRTKTSKTMPPPMSRASSGGPGMVAAAGQFGGRAQKRGSYGTQKGKSKSTSRSTSSGASPARIKASSAGSVTNQMQESVADPGQESTFCGIMPSSTLFFPFMPSLPAEPSLPKKCHRLYPCLDTISTALGSQVSINDVTPLTNAEAENDSLFKLILPEYDYQHPGASDPNSAQMLRRASLAAAIASARKSMSQMDRSKLIDDLRSVCALLKRQHDFVGQSVENMERWCRNNFSVEDHAEVFGSPSLTGKKRKSIMDSPSGIQSLGKNLAGYGGAVLRIKISCSGFKEPKMAAVLVARIPGTASRPAGAQKVEGGKKTTSKKRKVSSASTEFQSDLQGVGMSGVEDVLSYAKLKPSQRRQQVAEAVAVQAMHLERKYNEITQARQVSLLRQENELLKVAHGDDIHGVNTATLWEWVSKSSYFANYTEDDINEILHSAWQPTLRDKSVRELDIPPVRLVRGKRDIQDKGTVDVPLKLSETRLFDRLQSLLVDVGSDDEMSESDDESEKAWNGEGDIMIASETQDDRAVPQGAIFDFSELSVDERAYIQLRSIGLVDSPFFPSPNPVLIEEEEEVEEEPDYEAEEKGESQTNCNELDFVLRAMHSDLLKLQQLNNARTALLQSEARRNLAAGQQSRKSQEEQAQQIARYTQLMKRQKDSKRNARQKTAKQDEDWEDW